jgi:KDO2-lipid IV(A) lauroyltransferase
LFFVSELITFFVYRIIGYRKKVVFNNLSNAFPDATVKEIQHIARKYYRHMSVMIVENIYLRFANQKKMENHLVLENKELLMRLYEQHKNVVFMLGHYGNWEMAGILAKILPYKFAAVYKQLSSKIFDRIYFDIRSRMGVEPIEMKDIVRRMHQLNTQREPFALIMVADQAPASGGKKHWVRFLNQETAVYLGSEKLAAKFDMAVVYLELTRIKKGKYRVKPTLISDKPMQTKTFEITEQYFDLLQASILNGTRFWLWSHRRWKHQREN